MAEQGPSATVLIVYAPAVIPPRQVAAFAVEVARVGASAVRLPPAEPMWLADARTAIEAATDMVVLDPGADPPELLLGAQPLAELHAAGIQNAVVVGGAEIRALLAGLAAGAHLRAGSADTPGDGSPRHDVQLVGRAAALARLSGRVPMTPSEARAYLSS